MSFAWVGEQLRQICRTSGVRVSFDTTNTRDSFYRVSVEYVLNVCSRCDSQMEYFNISVVSNIFLCFGYFAFSWWYNLSSYMTGPQVILLVFGLTEKMFAISLLGLPGILALTTFVLQELCLQQWLHVHAHVFCRRG